MLSISLSKGGSQQADYYLNLARADYYLRGGEPLGRWFGKGAKLLQLEGDVDGDAFRNLVAGFFPNGRKAMVQNAGAADRQGGWDLCFSAPKSVSVLWSIAPECWKREIEVAHDLAVRAALSYLEQEAGYTRRGKDGLVTEKVGFVAALFEHGTSRANDPQLHTHAFLLNVGVREDGTTGTIVSRPTFIHKMAAGALYRAELAFQLTKRMPIALEVERTWFEIKGISKTLMETFSTRRAEIMEALKAYGERNATAAKRAAVETRGGKLHVPRSELFERWRAEAERHGHQYATLRDDLAAERPLMSRTPKLEPDKVVHELTIKDSHFTERTLVRALAERSQTGGISAEMILDAARRKVRSLYELELHNDERQFTTMAMLRLEKELFDRADAGRLDTRHVVPKPLVDQVLRDIVLSEEQGKAVRQITQEPGRVQIVQGWAGVGKSTLPAAARRGWAKEGYTVIGLALSGKAAESLEKSSGIKSITLARALTDIERHGWHTAWQPLFPGCPKWNPAHRL